MVVPKIKSAFCYFLIVTFIARYVGFRCKVTFYFCLVFLLHSQGLPVYGFFIPYMTVKNSLKGNILHVLFVWLIIGHIIMQKLCIKGVFDKLQTFKQNLIRLCQLENRVLKKLVQNSRLINAQ